MRDIDNYVKNCITNGNLIECMEEEYPIIRMELHRVASWMIDNQQGVRSIIALNEVKRLDDLFTNEK